MQQINVNELKPHPRNTEFFDDMTGEKWKEFLESIKSRGVIEPIVITHDKTIVSGHQRVRACEELGIPMVMCDVHTYENEDQVIQDLIETNIRQRGDVGGSAKKVGRRIKELERIYGVRDGSSGKCSLEPNKSVPKQKELAEMFGMSVDTLQNYKLLADMIPEIEDLLDTGIVTKTTTLAILKNLSEQEQLELISSLDTTKKITQNQMQKYIEEIRELRANPPKPSDYDYTKRMLQQEQSDRRRLSNELQSKNKEVQELKRKIEKIEEETPTSQFNKKLEESTMFFCARVNDFLKAVGGYVWLTEHINDLPDAEKKNYITAANSIYEWADALQRNIFE